MKKRFWLAFLATIVAAILLIGVASAADTGDGIVPYAVTGGNIYFDPAIGAITDCDKTVTEAIIPDTINGVAVTKITSYAFSGSALTSITIPGSVTDIMLNSIRGCGNLISINVSSENRYYASNNGVLFNANLSALMIYPKGKADTAYCVPNSVTSIESQAFDGCSSLTSIDLPDGLTSIGDQAFQDCSALTSITIPGSVTNIGGIPFLGCHSLTTIDVSPDNQYYVSDNDVLFNAELSELIAYPAEKSDTAYHVPDSVTLIESCAFEGCSSLTSIELPDGLTSIWADAFYGCSSLANIEIPDGVTIIEYSTFEGCSSLTNVKLPDGVTNIERRAFYGCSSLANIRLPDKLTSISAGVIRKVY